MTVLSSNFSGTCGFHAAEHFGAALWLVVEEYHQTVTILTMLGRTYGDANTLDTGPL